MGITRKDFYFKSTDNANTVFGCLWLDDGRSRYRGIVQIAHGMAEHILRYEEFAVFLAQKGFLVCGNDHIGHGRTAKTKADLGFFGVGRSERYIVKDMKRLRLYMGKKYKGLPYILIGHSMGSFLVREYISHYGKTIDAAVILGTSGSHKFIDLGILLSRICIIKFGSMARGYIVNEIAFKPFNMKIKNKRTDFDWICSDENVVDEFIDDKRCGFVFSYSGYNMLFNMLKDISSDKWYKSVPKHMPILIASGTEDPVGDYGKGVTEVKKRLDFAGVKNVTLKLYAGCRHEILNEKNKYIVYRYILRFINSVVDMI